MKLDINRRLLANRPTRRFLDGLGVSGIFVGIAVAAYTLPGVQAL